MKYAVVLRAPSLQRVMGPDCFWFLANIVDKCILRLIIEVVGLILIHSKEVFFGDGTLTSGSKITTLEKMSSMDRRGKAHGQLYESMWRTPERACRSH